MAKISLRRGAALALSGLLAAGTLAGCAAESTDGGATDTGSSSSAESTTIRVVAAQYTDDMQPYYDDLVARFEADNPTINVEVEVVSWNDIDQKIKTMVQTNDLPDIGNLNYFSSFAADGLLYTADELLPAATLMTWLRPSSRTLSTKELLTQCQTWHLLVCSSTTRTSSMQQV